MIPTKINTDKQKFSRPKRSRKQRLHRQIFIPDKPPFIKYTSEFINSYRYLPPIRINHDRHRHHKHTKRSKRKKETHDNLINKENQKMKEDSFSSEIIQSTDPIDLWPSDSNSFDMDFIRKRQITIDNTFYRETIDAWNPSSFNHVITLIQELIIEKNLIDRVWIIYYWISQNILYDIDANKQKLDDIFHSGKTTCEGYAFIRAIYVASSCLISTSYDENQPVACILIKFTNKVAVVGSLCPSCNRICRYPSKT